MTVDFLTSIIGNSFINKRSAWHLTIDNRKKNHFHHITVKIDVHRHANYIRKLNVIYIERKGHNSYNYLYILDDSEISLKISRKKYV